MNAVRRGFLILLILCLGLALSVGLYYYFALSGNPITGWREGRAVRSHYESRYPMSFEVSGSDYDYKRGTFSFELTPERDPEHRFSTTLHETSYKDVYGETRATAYLRKRTEDALTFNGPVEHYRFHVSEAYDSPAPMETDLFKRLSQNDYTISFSFDVERLDTTVLTPLFNEVKANVEDAIDLPIGGLTLRLSAYDGTDYAFEEIRIRDGAE